MAKEKAAKRKATTKAAARRSAPAVSAAKKKGASKGGRPPFRPTVVQRQQVEMLAGLGLRQEEIVLFVTNPTTGGPIAGKTLRRHFARELARGTARVSAKVARAIYEAACGDGPQAVTAAIWWLKCRMGWTERIVGDDEVRSGVLVAPAPVSPEAWIAAAAERSAEAQEPGVEGKNGT